MTSAGLTQTYSVLSRMQAFTHNHKVKVNTCTFCRKTVFERQLRYFDLVNCTEFSLIVAVHFNSHIHAIGFQTPEREKEEVMYFGSRI